jgi:hypothetical protein
MSAPASVEKPYDEMTKPEQEEHDRAARAKEQVEQEGEFRCYRLTWDANTTYDQLCRTIGRRT